VPAIEIEPIKPLIGAIVHIERSALFDEAVVQRCLEALEDRGVLVFPRIGLSDDEQLAFTDALGTRVKFTRGASDVYEITLDPQVNKEPEYVQGTYFWHIDGVTIDMPPPKATLLTARRISSRGGQTEFSNTYAAYEHLPEEEKKELEGLRAVHSVASSMRPVAETTGPADLAKWRRMGEYEHPIVWTHRTGRRSLLIGTHADRVVGMPLPDGRALLTRLQQWASQPAFCYRHPWQEGDLVVWDNCGTMHRVVPYDARSGRSMHRTSIAGVESVG
jgi:alpha-ketoglutarate-dependent taurine dioxygenase